MKRLIIILLALCLLVTCFACSKGGNDDSGKDPSGGPSGSENSGDPYDSLPEYNGRGEDFRICTREGYNTKEVFCSDEGSTDILDVALLKRNAAIKDRYNVIITDVTYGAAEGEQITQVINNAVLNEAGESDFELAMTYVYESAPLAIYGYSYNWRELPYTQLDRSYWMNSVNENFSIKDVIYTAVGKMCVSTITNTYATFYNRTQGEIIDPEMTNNIFAAIRSGDWTYDYFYNLVKDVYDEVDSDPGKSLQDFYGYRGSLDWSIDTFMSAWDIPMIKNDPETGLSDVFFNEKLVDAANKIYELYYNTKGTYLADMGDNAQQFASGKALFMHNWINCVFNDLAVMDDTYTILPYPKYDESQETYLNGVVDNYSVLTVPSNVADIDVVSIIVEALNIESEKRLYVAYRQEALHKKYLSDVDTIEMLQYVMDGVTFDIAVPLHSEVKMNTILRMTIINKSDIQYEYELYAENIASAIENIMIKFDLYKEK